MLDGDIRRQVAQTAQAAATEMQRRMAYFERIGEPLIVDGEAKVLMHAMLSGLTANAVTGCAAAASDLCTAARIDEVRDAAYSRGVSEGRRQIVCERDHEMQSLRADRDLLDKMERSCRIAIARNGGAPEIGWFISSATIGERLRDAVRRLSSR